jgi:hypothetical protein
VGGISEPISFRLASQFAERLDTEATKRGMSRGDYARQLVIDGLSGRRVDELSAEIAELRSSFQRAADRLLQGQKQLSESGEQLANSVALQAGQHQDRSGELGSALVAVDENVIRLREDFATGLVALLVHACNWELDDAVRGVDAKLINKQEI